MFELSEGISDRQRESRRLDINQLLLALLRKLILLLLLFLSLELLSLFSFPLDSLVKKVLGWELDLVLIGLGGGCLNRVVMLAQIACMIGDVVGWLMDSHLLCWLCVYHNTIIISQLIVWYAILKIDTISTNFINFTLV